MINNKKDFLIMVRNDIDVCHPKRGGEKVLFHKHIFKNEFEAREELKSKNLAPGEIAVARFYVNYEDEYINAGTPSYDAIRMIMAIGGATPHNTNDTYFFNDSFEVGDNDYITLAEIENILQSYYTKEEVEELIKNIPVIDSSNFATKEDIQNINNNIDNINSSISTVEETIETIQEDIENKSWYRSRFLAQYRTTPSDFFSLKAEGADPSAPFYTVGIWSGQEIHALADNVIHEFFYTAFNLIIKILFGFL